MFEVKHVIALDDRTYELLQNLSIIASAAAKETPEPQTIKTGARAATKQNAAVEEPQTSDESAPSSGLTPESAPPQEAAPETETPAQHTLVEVRALAKEKVDGGHREAIKAILAEIGVAAIPELTQEQRNDFYTRLEVL